MTAGSAPRVSVLLPVRNAAATLPACLASLRRQRWTDWEAVVVDDGSDDDGPAQLEVAAASDRRIRRIPRPRAGLVAALNAGLALCRGSYVARMDADDLMCRDRLTAQVAALERNPTWVAVGSHVRSFPRSALGRGVLDYERWLNAIDSPEALAREAWIECPLAHPTLMFRRDAVPPGNYRDLGWPEDYDLLLRWLTAGQRVGVVPRRLLCWRESSGRLWRSSPAYSRRSFARLKAHFLAASFLDRTEGYVLWGYGETGRLLRGELASLGCHPSHIVELHRGRLGNVIHGAPVVAPDALPSLRGRRLVVAVVGPGPRQTIRRLLHAQGFSELGDFVVTA